MGRGSKRQTGVATDDHLADDLQRDEPSEALLDDVIQVALRAARVAGVRPADAEDVAQETAIKVSIRWNSSSFRTPRARGLEGWRAFVAVVARNAGRDLHRKEDRRQGREQRALAVASPAVIEEYLGRRHLVEEIGRLPDRHRAVTWLVLEFGWRVSEAAAVLDLNPATARKYVREAKGLLRESLERGDAD